MAPYLDLHSRLGGDYLDTYFFVDPLQKIADFGLIFTKQWPISNF